MRSSESSRENRGSILFAYRGLAVDHFAAAVITVFGDVMAQMNFSRRWIGTNLLRSECIVRTAHTATGRGLTAFGNGHGVSPILAYGTSEEAPDCHSSGYVPRLVKSRGCKNQNRCLGAIQTLLGSEFRFFQCCERIRLRFGFHRVAAFPFVLHFLRSGPYRHNRHGQNQFIFDHVCRP